MCRSLFLVFWLLFFSACANKIQSVKGANVNLQEQSFDFRVMKAFSYERYKRYTEARDEFLALYLEYKSLSLLENAFMLTLFNNLDKKEYLNELAQPYIQKDKNITRLSVLYHLQIGDLSKALSLLEFLARKEKDPRNYELLAEIYAQKKQYNKSISYYNLAKKYADTEIQLEMLSLKTTQIYLLNKQLQKAKNELESFVQKNSCTPKICLILGKIYSDERNFNAVKKIYFKLYDSTGDKSFIYGIIEMLSANKKFKEALNIALKYELNNETLLFLQQNLRNTEETFKLLMKLYKEKGDKKYLLTAAVFEFEWAMNEKRVNKEILKSVSNKFEEAIDDESEALYLNYYGYLLIDYDLDIDKGMNLVKKALQKDPDNLYYLDSLAWGYYKKGDCEEAWNVMSKTMHDKNFANSQESQEHIKAIQNSCTLVKKYGLK